MRIVKALLSWECKSTVSSPIGSLGGPSCWGIGSNFSYLFPNHYPILSYPILAKVRVPIPSVPNQNSPTGPRSYYFLSLSAYRQCPIKTEVDRHSVNYYNNAAGRSQIWYWICASSVLGHDRNLQFLRREHCKFDSRRREHCKFDSRRREWE